MFLMDKEAGNGSRPRVEVLVGASGSHINSPVMEVELNVASCMGQIKTNIATLGQRGGGRKRMRERERERERERNMFSNYCKVYTKF